MAALLVSPSACVDSDSASVFGVSICVAASFAVPVSVSFFRFACFLGGLPILLTFPLPLLFAASVYVVWLVLFPLPHSIPFPIPFLVPLSIRFHLRLTFRFCSSAPFVSASAFNSDSVL